jgi:hypothetical protein
MPEEGMLYVFGAYDVYGRTDLAVGSGHDGREGLGCGGNQTIGYRANAELSICVWCR